MSSAFDLPALEARLRTHVAQLARAPRPAVMQTLFR
jgi:hypothetical protein